MCWGSGEEVGRGLRWRQLAVGRGGGRGAGSGAGPARGWGRRRGHAEGNPQSGETWEWAFRFFLFVERWQLCLLKRRGGKVNFFTPDPWEL